MDCSPQGSSVHGISQARILEWVAISFSRRSFWPRVQTHVSCIADGFFTTELPGNPWNVFLPCGNQHLWLLLRSYIQASVCVAPETQELPFFLNYWSWSKIFVQSVWQTVTIFEYSPAKNTGVGCHFLLQCMKVKSESEVAQSYLTLCDPMNCSPPGSSVHGIFQARILEWGAIAFSVFKTGNPIN